MCNENTSQGGTPVGEKRGFWLIPNTPLISAKNYFFPLFFCSTQQKPKLFSKNTNSSPIASIISMRSHFSPFFSAHLNRNKNHSPQIPFYVCDQAQLFSADFKHTFSSCDRIDFGKIPKISNSSSIGGVGDFRQNPLFSPTRQEER